MWPSVPTLIYNVPTLGHINWQKVTNMQDAEARTLIQEFNLVQKALAAIARELAGVRLHQSHTQEILTATRRELAEARVLLKQYEQDKDSAPQGVTRLVTTRPYNPPKGKVFEKSSPRVFINQHEVIGGKIEHIVRARDLKGNLIELPCSYDQAHKFISMEEINRRRYWRGKRDDYSAMLDLCLQCGLAERHKRGYRWAERYTPLARVEWVAQFRPPNRTR